jgi:Domain of unknown function (DUF929)
MGKAGRNRQQSVRQRIAAQQAATRRAERRRRILLAGGAVVVVVAIVVAIVVIRLNSGSSAQAPSGSTTGTLLPASVMKDVTGVPVSTLDAVGEDSVFSYNPAPVTKVSGTALTSGGKPEMLYIGAEFCPYCAAMRWSMAVALSRFGTLSPLHGIHSSSTDVFPKTATLTFYKSSYTSRYLVFTPVENETVSRALLQSPTPAELALWNKYDANSYPFIDFGNKYFIKAPIYDPGVLAGKTWAQIAAALHDPPSPIARGVLGAANVITAAICTMTGNQPAAVCASSVITGLQARL